MEITTRYLLTLLVTLAISRAACAVHDVTDEAPEGTCCQASGTNTSQQEEPGHAVECLTNRLIERVPAWMTEHHVPGVSIALIREREIVWSHQFGVKKAGAEGKVNEETVFEACSMSKPLFAYAVMRLVEEEILDLDRPLDSYLPEPYLPHEPNAAAITARMVLNHTTGLPNWRRGGRRTGILNLKHRPGERFTYSGEGMWYLQRVVEHLTGEPIDEYMKRTLMNKIGMNRSSYVWQNRYVENNAHGHNKEGAPKKYRHYTDGNTAFSLYTTPADYARYLILMMDADPQEDFQLRPATIDRMLTVESQRDDEVYYGLGWGLAGIPEHPYVFHGGSNGSGFRCHARFYRDNGSGIVIMTNADSGAAVYGKILEQVYP